MVFAQKTNELFNRLSHHIEIQSIGSSLRVSEEQIQHSQNFSDPE